MVSEGAISYDAFLKLPISEMLLIVDRLDYVLRQRRAAVKRARHGRS